MTSDMYLHVERTQPNLWYWAVRKDSETKSLTSTQTYDWGQTFTKRGAIRRGKRAARLILKKSQRQVETMRIEL